MTRLALINRDAATGSVNETLESPSVSLAAQDPSRERGVSDAVRAWAVAVGVAGCGRCMTAA